MEYIYFVSYNYPLGSGNIEITQDFEMTEMQHIKGVQDIIKDRGIRDAVVTNYQLLRVEPSND